MKARAQQTVLVGLGIAATLSIAAPFAFRTHRAEMNHLPTTNATGPQPKAFADYAGSASCRACHEEAYADWAKSNHGLAERAVSFDLDHTAFQTTKPLGNDLPATSIGERDGKFFVATIGLSGRRETNFVERVIGNDPLQQFLVAAPGGRWQPLEASWDVHRHEWFNSYGHEQRQPGEWGHWTGRGMNWNSMCATCHNTQLRKNYHEATDTYHTTMAERTVGCESCHGPLKAHNEWQQAHGKSGKSDPTLRRLSRQQTLDNCGQCHSRRAELTGDFAPGAAFQDHFDLDVVDGSDIYFPDGQVREENFEFAAFLGSRMHAAGVSCNDCHQPHTGKVRLPGNWLCLQCHGGGNSNAPKIDPVAHSHHKVRGYDADGKLTVTDLTQFSSKDFTETGGECVNCHMPQTTYMQRHARHDHGFTIPDPLLTKQFGIPNACNRCHQDQSVDWALAATEKWYGSRMERPSRRRAQTLAKARAGDATAVAPLLDLLAGNETPYWKAAAINLLAPWAAEPPVQTALLQNVSHTNALVRTKAVQTLEASTEPPPAEIEASLRAKLNDEIRSVRIAAAWALRASLETNHAAVRELELYLDHNADQPAGQMQKGAFSVARNDLPNAVKHYQRAVAWETNSAALRHDLAVAYSIAGQPQQALTELRTAARLDSENAEYRYKLALAWHEAGNTRAAAVELENAVRLNPHHVRAWYNLGLALDVLGDTTKAVKALEQAVTLDPTNLEIPRVRSTILLRQRSAR